MILKTISEDKLQKGFEPLMFKSIQERKGQQYVFCFLIYLFWDFQYHRNSTGMMQRYMLYKKINVSRGKSSFVLPKQIRPTRAIFYLGHDPNISVNISELESGIIS